ncbi:MAG: DNA adenine methylase [Aureispira sp.]
MKKLKAFPYFGGKYKVLEELYELMPQNSKHFVDVFGGSMTVALNYPNKSAAITACDVNGDIINFFTILREETDSFIQDLRLTLCAESEYIAAWEGMSSSCRTERARSFFIRSMMGFYGLGSQNTKRGKGIKFAMGRQESKCVGRTEVVSRWDNGVERLLEVASAIRKRVQVIEQGYQQTIPRFDFTQAFFYLDPPYDPNSRSASGEYKHDFTEEDHRTLALLLYGIEGKAMVSGYRNELMQELYEQEGWKATPLKHQEFSNLTRRKLPPEKQEWIWTNYSPNLSLVGKQQRLF